jgi:ribose/xylose/arabinose/galactoside ABC-type transport system permease subunit
METNLDTDRKNTFRKIGRQIIRNENAILGFILIILIAIFGVLTKGFSVSPRNIRNVIVQSSIRGVTAIGQTFVMLTAGIDIAVGGIATMCMAVGGVMMTGTTGFPLKEIPIMLFVGMGIGATTGLVVSRIKVPPLMATIALWQILQGASLRHTGGYTISNLPSEFSIFGQGAVAGSPVPITIFIVTAIVAHFVITYTSFGRSVVASGGNPISAWLSGVNVQRMQFFVYIISGFCAALGGIIIMSRTMSASLSATAGLELDAIGACVIGGVSLSGGKGNIIGVVIGVMIIGVLNNALNTLAVNPAAQEITKGAVIYAAVMIDSIRRPKG